MVSVERTHNHANLLSLKQRRQKQILFQLFIYNNRHDNIRRVRVRNTRAVDVYSCHTYK